MRTSRRCVWCQFSESLFDILLWLTAQTLCVLLRRSVSIFEAVHLHHRRHINHARLTAAVWLQHARQTSAVKQRKGLSCDAHIISVQYIYINMYSLLSAELSVCYECVVLCIRIIMLRCHWLWLTLHKHTETVIMARKSVETVTLLISVKCSVFISGLLSNSCRV